MNEPTGARKDIRMDVRFRNNCILSKMESVGVESVAELARRIGVSVMSIHCYVNMTQVPFNKKGKMSRVVIKMCEFFKCSPEELFSSEQMETKLEKNRAAVEVSFEGVRAMLEHQPSELLALEDVVARDQIPGLITQALEHLTVRQRLVLTKRFGLQEEEEHTLEQVAEVLGVTRERVRQIEAKALRRMRNPSVSAALGDAYAHQDDI